MSLQIPRGLSLLLILLSSLSLHASAVTPLSSASLSLSASSPHIRSLPLGLINGSACSGNPSVSQFLGVPFAKPPLGPLRYRPALMYDTLYPMPALQATTIPPPCGSICSLSTTAKTVLTEDISSEDCLYLNIWAPVRPQGEPASLPVRVYIHGGAVNLCSASDDHLNGCSAVAKTEMIQVNIQFRRGPFGYLAHPATFQESNSTGNWAFLDQQLALQWVQENIEFFGGDKNNVMINGQSGGAQCVDFHQVAPGSNGLFQSAISQSPPCVRLITLEQAYEISTKFMEMVGCSSLSSPEAELECMRELPWLTLMTASRTVSNANFARVIMCEGSEWFSFFHYTLDYTTFPYQPAEALALGKYAKVPYVVGTTTNEGSYFQSDIIDFFGSPTAPLLPQLMDELFPNVNPDELLSIYNSSDIPSAQFRLAMLWTDVFYTCPIHKRLVARATVVTTPQSYLYSWNVTPSCPPETVSLGPTHTSELRASFGITEDIPCDSCDSGLCNYNGEEVKLSNVLLRAWTTTAALKAPLFPSRNPWKAWDTTNQYGTFISINTTKTTALNPTTRCLIIEDFMQAASKRSR